MVNYNFSKHSDDKKIKLNIVNLIVYLCIYIAICAAYAFVTGYMLLIILVFLTIAPILSYISLHLLMKRIELSMTISDSRIDTQTPVSVGFILKNNSYFMSLHIGVSMDIDNAYLGTTSSLTFTMPTIMNDTSKMSIPLQLDLSGILHVVVKKIEIKDLLGLYTYRYSSDMQESVLILPTQIDTEDIDKEGFYSGISEIEENNQKGNDFSDVSNIREYIPGDRIKDIHWKLSAKKEDLMVKERVRLAERQLNMYIETEGENKEINQVIQYAYSVIKLCINENIPVRLIWFNPGIKGIEEYSILNKNDIDIAFRSMYECGVNKGVENIDSYIVSYHENIRSYVKVCMDNGSPKVVTIDNV